MEEKINLNKEHDNINNYKKTKKIEFNYGSLFDFLKSDNNDSIEYHIDAKDTKISNDIYFLNNNKYDEKDHIKEKLFKLKKSEIEPEEILLKEKDPNIREYAAKIIINNIITTNNISMLKEKQIKKGIFDKNEFSELEKIFYKKFESKTLKEKICLFLYLNDIIKNQVGLNSYDVNITNKDKEILYGIYNEFYKKMEKQDKILNKNKHFKAEKSIKKNNKFHFYKKYTLKNKKLVIPEFFINKILGMNVNFQEYHKKYKTNEDNYTEFYDLLLNNLNKCNFNDYLNLFQTWKPSHVNFLLGANIDKFNTKNFIKIKITNKKIIIKNFNWNSEILYYIFITYSYYHTLEKIEFENTYIKMDVFNLFYKLLISFSRSVKTIIFNNIELNQRIIKFIFKFVENFNLNRLDIINTSLESYNFGMLILKILNNNTISHFDFRNNNIDDEGVLCFTNLIRYYKNLKYFDLRNNIYTMKGLKEIRKAIAFGKILKFNNNAFY